MSGTNQHVATPAERFKALRSALGLTQEDLMRGAGKQRTAVSKVESGENQLTGAKLLRVLSEAVGLSMEALQDYVEGKADLAATLPLCRPRKKAERKPSTIPPPAAAAAWFEIDEEARRVATMYLRQPPQKFEAEAVEEAFRRIRMRTAEAASDPEQVANAVRAHIWGISATRFPSEPPSPDTRHSGKQ